MDKVDFSIDETGGERQLHLVWRAGFDACGQHRIRAIWAIWVMFRSPKS